MQKTCKGCGKALPEGYKYKKCEACRNKRNDVIKTALAMLGGAAVIVLSLTGRKK